MTREDVDAWLDAYVRAWRSYDRDEIAALFSDDVVYRYHPWDEPVAGREAVVASWLGEADDGDRDPEGTYDAEYRAVAVDGDTAVATGTSWYLDSPGGEIRVRFHNAFLMRFDGGGRCSGFTEWFMQAP